MRLSRSVSPIRLSQTEPYTTPGANPIMFEDIPTDAPPEYLSGIAAFVASDGEKTRGIQKQDYAWLLNQITGLDRVPADEDNGGRATQVAVPSSEAGDRALDSEDYTNNIFDAELQAWSKALLDTV